MDASSLEAAYLDLQADLTAWGKYVTSTIANEFRGRQTKAGSAFFPVPPSCRVKDQQSFVEKALYRGKAYTNPLVDITDKVATRFVLLLQEDTEAVCKFIMAHTDWDAEQHLDYHDQRQEHPEQFLYESHHFIVRPTDGFILPDLTVSPAITCEIQVRTLLQHAYSELSHGTTYKGTLKSDSYVKRQLARSMALIETTDDIFSQVIDKIGVIEAPMSEMIDRLTNLYDGLVAPAPAHSARMNEYILDALQPLVEEIDDVPTQVQEFIGSDETWLDVLEKWAPRDLLFQQPVVLLLMYLAKRKPSQLKSVWPLSEEQYDYLLSSMGIAA